MDLLSWLAEVVSGSQNKPAEPLVLGAELKCSCGSSHSYLYLETDGININNLPQANVEDCIAYYNISPFGTCQSGMAGTGLPCEGRMILAAQWENLEPQKTLSNGKEIITTKSTLFCLMGGGEISAVTSGQEAVFAKYLILYAEIAEGYPGLLEILQDPYGSLYLDGEMHETAFRFLEDRLARNGGEMSLASVYKGEEPEEQIIRVILERLIPGCKKERYLSFLNGIVRSVGNGRERVGIEVKKKEWNEEAWKKEIRGHYEYLSVLDHEKLGYMKEDCRGRAEEIQGNGMKKWLEGHKKLTSDLVDGLGQLACAAVLFGRKTTITPLEDSFDLIAMPGNASGDLAPMSSGGAFLPVVAGNKINPPAPVIGFIPGPVQGGMMPSGELVDGSQYVGGNSDIVELSNSNIQHIKKHTFDGMAKQANYLTDKQLANKLNNISFFSKDWSQDEIIRYTQEAYNILRSQGKTGLQSIEINGEIINVFIKDDGTFDTAYGIYKYTVDDFR